MRITMRQLMDENARLLKNCGTERRKKAEARDQCEKNLMNINRHLTPLAESLSGDENTARELLEPDFSQEWVVDNRGLTKKQKSKHLPPN